MSINLVESIQKKLGYAPLQKINPNTQEVKEELKTPVNYLAQAVIPAVLIGMYKKVNTDEGCMSIISGDYSSSWASYLFEGDTENVVAKIAEYANSSETEVLTEVEKIAQTSQGVVRENVKGQDCKSVRNFFYGQVANLEKYLPGALHLGDSLKDNTLDDRTHKMGGPVSGVMHFIESFFSDAGNKRKPFNPTDDTVQYH